MYCELKCKKNSLSPCMLSSARAGADRSRQQTAAASIATNSFIFNSAIAFAWFIGAECRLIRAGGAFIVSGGVRSGFLNLEGGGWNFREKVNGVNRRHVNDGRLADQEIKTHRKTDSWRLYGCNNWTHPIAHTRFSVPVTQTR